MELKDLISDRRPDTLNRGKVREILDADGDYRNKGWGGQTPPQPRPPEPAAQPAAAPPAPTPAVPAPAATAVAPPPAPTAGARPAGTPTVPLPALKSAQKTHAEIMQRKQMPRPDFVVEPTLTELAYGCSMRLWLPNGPFRVKSATLHIQPGAPDGQRYTLWRRGVAYVAEARVRMPVGTRREGSCLYQYHGLPLRGSYERYRNPFGTYARFITPSDRSACYYLKGQGLPVYGQPNRLGDAYIWMGRYDPWELPPMPKLPRARYRHTLPAAWLRSVREGIWYAISKVCRRIFGR